MLNPVEKSIGAASRDYSTIAGWESDTDDNCVTGFGAGDYASPCSPVGVLYDDADFNEVVTISGATTSENYHRKLTVAEGERHDGGFPKSPVGVTITDLVQILNYDNWFELEWVIIYRASLGGYGLYLQYLNNSTTLYVRNIIVDIADYHGVLQSDGGLSYTVEMYNSIIIARRGGGGRCLNFDASPSTAIFRNCTAYYAGDGYGAFGNNNTYYYNTIAVGGGARAAWYGTGNGDYNAGGNSNGSTDTTAPGINSIDSIDPDLVFTDTTDGAEDLHLLSGSTVVAAGGTSQSTYFTIDIDGDTRSNWDIGADEYVSSGSTLLPNMLNAAQPTRIVQ